MACQGLAVEAERDSQLRVRRCFNLAATPFTTTGGGKYVFPPGFMGSLFAISSNNIALGFFENAPSVLHSGSTLQEDGAAADLSTGFLLPISLTNIYVVPY